MSTFSEQKLIWGHQGQNGVQRAHFRSKKTREKNSRKKIEKCQK
jgi:hypothetical protein